MIEEHCPNCQDGENKRLYKQTKKGTVQTIFFNYYLQQMITVFIVLTYCQISFENIEDFFSKEVKHQRWSLRRRYGAFPLETFQ